MSTLMPRPHDRVRPTAAESEAADSMSPENLAAFLAQRLRDRRALPRPTMSPELSYGRHRGPAAAQARMAAVAVALYRDRNLGWTIPLTLRPRTLQHHGGQVCLPGGQIEPKETPYQAAIREFEEELGVRPVVRFHCGELSPQYVYASGNLVHPVVTIVESPESPWVPDPEEVHEVITLPLRALQDPSCRKQTVRWRAVRAASQEVDRLVYHAEAIEYEGYLVWGATALILDQLAQILQS